MGVDKNLGDRQHGLLLREKVQIKLKRETLIMQRDRVLWGLVTLRRGRVSECGSDSFSSL